MFDTKRCLSPDFSNRASWPLWFFSFCIVALSFKQFRNHEIAGPLEWGVAFVVFVILVDGIRRRALFDNPYALGGTAMFAILSLGGAWALVVDPSRLSLREAAAYFFSFSVVMAFMVLARHREAIALSILAVVVAGYLILATIGALVPNPLQPMMWYYDIRFQGLSDNPNQIAFLSTAGLVLVAYAEYRDVLPRPLALLLAMGCAFAGILTLSTAFTATSAVIMALIVASIIVEFSLRGNSRKAKGRLKGRPLSLVVAAAIVLGHFSLLHINTIIQSLPSGDEDGSYSSSLLGEVMQRDGQEGAVRVELWKQAWVAGMESPLVGFGPGYHINVHGQERPREAHNTLLDIFLVSGSLGLLALFSVAGLAISAGLKNGNMTVLILMGAAIAIFGTFHFVARQPIFWIIIFAVVYGAGSYEFLKREVMSWWASRRGAAE